MTPRLRDDSGMSTVEVIVAMALAGILGIITLFAFLTMNRAADSSMERALTASEARAALDAWNDLLAVRESPAGDAQAQPAIEAIDDDEIVFYASLDNRPADSLDVEPPTKIHVYQLGGLLIEERFFPDGGGYPEDPTVRRLLGENATLTITAYAAGETAPMALGDLDNAERSRIERIDLGLVIRDGTGAARSFGATS